MQVQYDTDVPADETPSSCPYCQRPLGSEELVALHKGLDHWERLDDEERETFYDAYEDESEDLRTFRLKMLGILMLVYFGFLFTYSYFSANPFM
ncbi:hypothetical protein [Halorussus halophilus]|uniref:hypothetical protein n=1 Tax=Halorussus halophilus TaxID=2650975 RepID=UPI0013013D05|nr:hypothetical protein [Halorussus halophilus]